MKIFVNCTMKFPSLLSRMTLNIGLPLHLPESPFISQKGISWSLNIGELVVSVTRVPQQPMLHHPSEHEPVNVHSCFSAPPRLNLNPCGLMSSLRSDAAKSLWCFSDFLAWCLKSFPLLLHPPTRLTTANRSILRSYRLCKKKKKDGWFSTNKINIWHKAGIRKGSSITGTSGGGITGWRSRSSRLPEQLHSHMFSTTGSKSQTSQKKR